jgi:SSS family transporter
MEFWDYSVMAVYLLSVVGIGWYFSKNENSTDDYLLGGRSIPWWAIAISMFATLMSALSFLGVPSEAFGHGCRLGLSLLIAPFALILSIWLFMRFYYTLGTFTPYEYLERRFSPSVRLICSILFLVQRGIYLALVLYASAVAFKSAAGWNPVFTICLVGILGIIYTVLGGMKAVVWTDVLQFFVLFGGLAFIIIRLSMMIPGGFSGGVEYAFSNGRGFNFGESFFTFNPYERVTLWLLLFSSIGTYMFGYSADQLNIQRLLSTRTYSEAKKAAYTSWAVGVPVITILYLIGILLYSFYTQAPQGAELKKIANDHALPNFIVNYLPSPIPGIIMSALLAAIMSTLDSGMNSLSAILVKDIYKRFIRKDADEKQELKMARWFTVVVGIYMVAMAIFINALSSQASSTIIEAASIWSAVVMILVGVYLLGVTNERASSKLIISLLIIAIPITIASAWLFYYSAPPDHRISFTITGNIPGVFVIVCGFAALLFCKKQPREKVEGLTLFTLREPVAMIEDENNFEIEINEGVAAE